MGQNDSRSNQIINKLIGLRDGLDTIFDEVEEQLETLEHQNEDLRKQLKSGGRERMIETYADNPQTAKRYEQQIETLRNEIDSLRQK